MMNKPTEIGQYRHYCDKCKIEWIVDGEIEWKYYKEYRKENKV
jgi:hypothetical protein